MALLGSWTYMGWLSMAFGFLGEDLLVRMQANPKADATVRDLGLDRLLVLGFLLITALLAVFSLFHAIDGWAHALFVGLGVGLTYRYRAAFGAVAPKGRAAWRRLGWRFKGLAGTVLFVASVGTLCAPIIEIDAQFYHIPAMIWAQDYAVVPGLGNLNGRLAFNSHYFLSGALFSVSFPNDRLLLPVFSFFFALLLLRLAWNMEQGRRRGDRFFWALNGLVFLLFLLQSLEYINGLSTDYIVTFLSVNVLLLVLERHPKASRELRFFWITFALLAAFTFKLSAAYLLVLLPFLLFPVSWKKLVFLAAVAALTLAPWFYRNYVLSGYLVYPLAQVDLFEPDWKVPRPLVELERDFIGAFARIPEQELLGETKQEAELVRIYQEEATGGRWVAIWWNQKVSPRQKMLLAINALSVLFLFLALFRRERQVALVLFATIACLLAWFFTAPDPRFAMGPMMVNAAIVLAYGIYRFDGSRRLPLTRWVYPLLMLVALLVLVKNEKYYRGGKQWPASSFLVPLAHNTPEMVPVRGMNFTYFTPPVLKSTYFGLECETFRGPCTPFPKPGLMMRGDNLQDGFRIAPEVLSPPQ